MVKLRRKSLVPFSYSFASCCKMANALSCAAVGGGDGGAPFFTLGGELLGASTVADGPCTAAVLEDDTPVELALAAAPGAAEPAGAAEAAGAADAAAPTAAFGAWPAADNGKTTPTRIASKPGMKTGRR